MLIEEISVKKARWKCEKFIFSLVHYMELEYKSFYIMNKTV